MSGEKWSLRPMKKSLEDQLSSWLLNIPGLSSQADKKELTALKGEIWLLVVWTARGDKFDRFSQKCWTR